jgi:hypothetical protein
LPHNPHLRKQGISQPHLLRRLRRPRKQWASVPSVSRIPCMAKTAGRSRQSFVHVDICHCVMSALCRSIMRVFASLLPGPSRCCWRGGHSQVPRYICPPNDKPPAIQRMNSADPSAQTAQSIEAVKSKCQHRVEIRDSKGSDAVKGRQAISPSISPS